jgi:hypothetical protein
MAVTGHYWLKLSKEYLNIVASCTVLRTSELGRVFIDDVVLAPSKYEDNM